MPVAARVRQQCSGDRRCELTGIHPTEDVKPGSLPPIRAFELTRCALSLQ